MAAGGDPNNIQLGAGRVYVAPVGTAEPASASAALPSAWRPVGYTEDGTTVTLNVTVDEVEVAEEYDPVAYVNTKRTTQVSLSMAEASRRNLALAVGGVADAANDATSYEPPDPGEESAFMLIWDSDEVPTTNQNARWLFRSCKVSGSIETSHKKAPAKSLLPVTIMVQKPAGGSRSFKVWPNASGQVA
jgi:hypothetical protein